MAKEVQPAQKNASLFKSILSGCLGNVLEWYDYGLYGYFAVVISAEFFTSEDPVVGILMSFMVFGVGFVVRPIGGLIMGAYADKHGRVKSLTVTIMAIGICTMLMGCLPTYEQIGIMAPILLTVLRLLQGLATGGEFGSALTFISEFNNGKNTSFLVSWQPFSVGVGMLIGSITGLICTSVLSQPDLYAWGWRIPFLIGIVVAIYGVYLRKSVPEPPEFEKMKEQKKAAEEDHTPVKVLFKKHWVAMITNIGLLAGTSVSYYLLVTYLPTYIKEFVGGTMLEGFIVNTAVVAVYLVLCPFAGMFADKFGRRKSVIIACLGFIVLAYPVFWAVINGHAVMIMICALACLLPFQSLNAVAVATAASEVYPTETRNSGVGLAYNLAAAVFGGMAPAIATAIIAGTGNAISLAFFIIAADVVSILVAIFLMKRYYRKDGTPVNS